MFIQIKYFQNNNFKRTLYKTAKYESILVLYYFLQKDKHNLSYLFFTKLLHSLKSFSDMPTIKSILFQFYYKKITVELIFNSMMQILDNGENTQRVISNDKLITDYAEKPMPTKKKVVIGFSIFFTIAALVGLAVGLYFNFSTSSTHLMTTVAQANDGTVYSSTKFQYTDHKMIGDSVNQTFTIMFAGLNSTQTQRRILQSSEQFTNVDTTIHYTHESGIQIKFKGNEILNISVPIDQVVDYIDQQSDESTLARLLDADITQYTGQDQSVDGSDIYNSLRDEVLAAIQQIYPNTDSVNVYMKDVDIYEMEYDENSGAYKYVNAATDLTRRRLWSFRHFFHKVGGFVKKVGHDVKNFVKKDGPKILKYGAIAALAGIDIAAKGPSGISDAVKMFKSGNVLEAAELAAEGVATRLPPYLSIPIQFIAQACFSHPPKMHCTKQAALKAAKTDALDYVKKHALTTILSLLE